MLLVRDFDRGNEFKLFEGSKSEGILLCLDLPTVCGIGKTGR